MVARTKTALRIAAIASGAITVSLLVGELRYLESAAAYAEYVVINFAFYFGAIGAVLLTGSVLLPAMSRLRAK